MNINISIGCPYTATQTVINHLKVYMVSQSRRLQQEHIWNCHNNDDDDNNNNNVQINSNM
jgi:hypothetical protein